MIMSSALKTIVVITDALRQRYKNRYAVIADKLLTAPDGADPIPVTTAPAQLQGTGELKIGYMVHLYQGRGLEVIEFLAKSCPWADFHVVGGRPEENAVVQDRMSHFPNVYLHGFVPPAHVDSFKLACDVLIAPYQTGLRTNAGHNTVRWMSPLKIFEYMAAGKAIICSDLPVLREVIVNNHNAILVPPAEFEKWTSALERLRNEQVLRERLGAQARKTFSEKYTWAVRAKQVIRIDTVKSKSKTFASSR